jgi:16S rRNA (adenine1518-N6/adenine1519-N6)-dimethyltransferase
MLKAYGIRPSRRLGQSFLTDEAVARRVVDAAQLAKEEVVLEIGPGLGILTEHLLERSSEVIAVEIDERLCNLLSSRFGEERRFVLINRDVLRVDIGRLAEQEASGRLVVVAALPYSISSSALLQLMRAKRSIDRAVLVLQREVAMRLWARPGEKSYGALTIFVNYTAAVRSLFPISPHAFYPQPKVESVALGLGFHRVPPVAVDDEERFRALVVSTLSHRRKMARNAIRPTFGLSAATVRSLEDRTGIDLGRRAETFSLDEFALLANTLGEITCPGASSRGPGGGRS